MSDDTGKCTMCKKIFPRSDFMSEKFKKQTLLCSNCRLLVNTRRKMNRTKEREVNEADYLARQARIQVEWRKNNPQIVRKWRSGNVHYCYKGLRHQAKTKGIHWDDETFPLAVAERMMMMSCEYCGIPPTGRVHGIDRMNNNDHYTLSNCVPCCKECNFIKKCLDPTTFIDRCLHISALHGNPGRLDYTAWPSEMRTSLVSSQAYADRATRKGLPFEMTMVAFESLRSNPCHYCGHVEAKNGIDRKDNALGYCETNCVACCKECNHMKSYMSDTEFIASCVRVAGFGGRTREYSDIPRTMKTITKRNLMDREVEDDDIDESSI